MDSTKVKSKPYRRIVLHAGLHKTGTTSIQDNCLKHRDWLREHKIIYPVFNFQERQYANHSDPIAAALFKPPRMYGMDKRLPFENDLPEARRVFSEQFQRTLQEADGDTLLLSAELVCDFVKEDFTALRRHLEKFTDDLQVIAFVRSPQSSLESILQQQSLFGKTMDASTLAGLVQRRYQRLQRSFSDILRILNYHQAVEHPAGLVGYFLSQLGLPLEEISSLEFNRANKRISMEAYRLIDSINTKYPAGTEQDHGLRRRHNDVGALASLPGRPFQIENLKDSELYRSVTLEGEWLERELGFKFPEITRDGTQPLWQTQTLLALESAINRLDSSALRDVATDTLASEAVSLQTSDPDAAAILNFTALRIKAAQDPPIELILEKLGADYFKFSGLQVERDCPELALSLMLLALKLRPDAPFMKERIQHYRDKLHNG